MMAKNQRGQHERNMDRLISSTGPHRGPLFPCLGDKLLTIFLITEIKLGYNPEFSSWIQF